MNKKIILTSIAGTALFLSAALPAHANPVPEFGNCLNPQWSKTQENVGNNHGVVGVGAYAGTDTIYKSNENVMQCLCTNNGKGYQTNWLKADKMSKSQIDELKTKGWIYVPYGDDWGLDKTAYLAKNSEYTCVNCTTTPTPSVTATPTPTNTTENKKEVKKEESNVQGLANTGSELLIAVALLAGAASLAVGTVLKKFSK